MRSTMRARNASRQLQAHHSLHYSQSKLGHQTKKADGEYSGYGLHDGPVPLQAAW